jgi:3-dehydroquinate synthase
MFSTEIKSLGHTYKVTTKKKLELDFDPNKTFFIVDKRFEPILNSSDNVFFVDAIESCKNLNTVDLAIRAMVDNHVNRTSHLVVIGGGLIQDVGTLIASLYMRGIEWTYVPTTLMSMVDSCIGGKSSINVANYKNIVGNIYPPQEIQIYTDFTNTLSAIDIVAGELEAIKICFARGQNSFDKFVQLLNDSKTDPLALPGLISHVINSKKHFVEEDEFDKGIRQLLNFGHTFGHALESASNYRIPHGVAIGIGMLAAKDFAKSDRSDYHERLVQNVLKIFSRIPDLLPQMIETVDFGLFETAFKADKKHTAENFALIVPVREELQMIWVARSEENLELVNRSLKTALEQLEALS